MLVSRSLDRGAALDLLVDRARKLDEVLAKVAGSLAVADLVFDVPESVVD